MESGDPLLQSSRLTCGFALGRLEICKIKARVDSDHIYRAEHVCFFIIFTWPSHTEFQLGIPHRWSFSEELWCCVFFSPIFLQIMNSLPAKHFQDSWAMNG